MRIPKTRTQGKAVARRGSLVGTTATVGRIEGECIATCPRSVTHGLAPCRSWWESARGGTRIAAPRIICRFCNPKSATGMHCLYPGI